MALFGGRMMSLHRLLTLLLLVTLGSAYIPCDEVCPDGLRPLLRTCECPPNCGFVCADDSTPTLPGCRCPEPNDCGYVECEEGQVPDENCYCAGSDGSSKPSDSPSENQELPTPLIEDGFSYWGSDLPGSPFQAASASDCANQCARTSSCRFFTWASCGTNECWLKTSNSGRIRFECSISGRASKTPVELPSQQPSGSPSENQELPTPMSEDGFGYWGYDLPGSPFQAATASECSNLCARTPSCRFFTWASCGTNECWLKVSNAGRRQMSCSVSGRGFQGQLELPTQAPATQAPQPSNANGPTLEAGGMENNWDYFGYDLPGSPFEAPSPFDCAAMCDANSQCNYFTWDVCGGSKCWLKTSNSDRRANQCRVSGRRSNASPPAIAESSAPPVVVATPPNVEVPPPSGGREYGIDYYGNDIAGGPFDETLDGCAQMCLFVAGCTHYSWDSCSQNRCWLKTSAGGRVSDSCRVSGSVLGLSRLDKDSTSATGPELSTGAVAAIAVAAILVAIAIVVAVILIYKRQSAGASTYNSF